MALGLRYAARSDVGMVRRENEDSGYASPRLLVVADGMGGHAAGELASATAVATLAEVVDGDGDPGETLASLAAGVHAAGVSIGQVVIDNPDLVGMGTTATALSFIDEGSTARVAVVHVGDSRGYLLRAGDLTRITHDHTYVQTLIDAGRISEDEAAAHPRRSLIMRAIDGLQPADPDLSVIEARAGDRFLLCSDGLTGVVSDEELR
ncbi:MAG: PP2C family protein-serine/threonine phosphatase, partial [Ilumatobacteraceae bacterium]